MHRRAFLASGILGGSGLRAQTGPALPPPHLALPFVPPPGPYARRLSVFELALRPGDLIRFRESVRRMKELAPADPRQFFQQARLEPGGVNWNFLPWCRAMLYFHERLLNRLLPARRGEPAIRVPYWPWENVYATPARTAPLIYAEPNQPLFAVRRPFSVSIDVEPCLALRRGEDFVGTAKQAPAVFAGPFAEVVSATRLTPSDPLFYPHLANIDRLWTSWEALGDGRRTPPLREARGYFFDEDGRWRVIDLNFAGERQVLSYEYSTLMKPLHPGEPRLAQVHVFESRLERLPAPADYLLLRGVRVAALGKFARFGVFSGDEMLGSFSTASAKEDAEGWTVSVPAKGLQLRALLRVAALTDDGRAIGRGIPLLARDVLAY
ncbi:MAG: tyrosinase family protein [Acidobacteria bacterium]|nr:tyrosinase family protein [Acidobacteriota bacterium]